MNNRQIQNVNIDLIIPNRFQPRLTFDEKALNELADSIKEHGIIQPLVVRKLNDKYEIIAGERRYKAATLAGLTEVPVIITDIDDNKSAEIALVENVQRKNLNSMEEAKSYKKILDRGYLTQEALAQKMGISQSTLANKLRLLNLTKEVQDALLTNRISERHARSLLLVTDPYQQINLLNRVVTERLTVRQLDEIIKSTGTNDSQEVKVLEPIAPEPVAETPAPEPKEEEEMFNPFASSGDNIFDAPSEIQPEPPKEEPEEEQNFNPFASSDANIFDVGGEEETPVTPEAPKEEVKEEPTIEPAIEEPKEELEDLDILEEPKEEPEEKKSIFDFFKEPSFTSLEDEAVNMNFGDNTFNPFNIPQEEELINPPLEEKEEVAVESKPTIQRENIASVKAAFDNLKKEIEAAGYNISLEDFDFEDIYQLIVKINK